MLLVRGLPFPKSSVFPLHLLKFILLFFPVQNLCRSRPSFFCNNFVISLSCFQKYFIPAFPRIRFRMFISKTASSSFSFCFFFFRGMGRKGGGGRWDRLFNPKVPGDFFSALASLSPTREDGHRAFPAFSPNRMNFQTFSAPKFCPHKRFSNLGIIYLSSFSRGKDLFLRTGTRHLPEIGSLCYGFGPTDN